MRRDPGFTLVELVMFIVLTGIAFSSLLLAMNQFTRYSADPLVRKQALAIAESLLDEIELMPFTTCDPDGYDAATGACTLAEGIGAETSEDRYSAATPFDNVNDYHNFAMTTGGGGIKNINGDPVPGLAGYSASVTVAQSSLGAIPADKSLLITVTVTAPDSSTLTLHGFRTKYNPTP